MEKYTFTSPVLKDFDPTGYHFFGLWRQNLFPGCFWTSCWSKEIVDKLGISSTEGGALELGEGYFFLKNSEIDNIKKQLYRKIDDHDEEFFRCMVATADEYFKAAVAYADTIKDKQLTPEDFQEFVMQARHINFLWMLGAEQFSEAAQAKLTEMAAEESFPVDDLSGLIPVFTTPLNEQHREVLELRKEVGHRTLAEVRNDTVLSAKFEDHVRRFAWIEIHNFAGEPFTVEKLYEQIVHAQDEPAHTCIHDLSASPKLAFHARCMSYCGYIRQAGAEYYAILSEKALPYLHAIAHRFELTYPEFLLQRDTEILAALKGSLSAVELKAQAQRRAEMNYVIFASVGTDVFFSEDPEDVATLIRRMVPRADTGDGELTGQVGNRGTYTGPVRIIMDTHDFAKMQAGDVLVSTMTTPDFVVLMNKAGAIVTDIGGMLCHAAIVSREINKPCVIGTKFATQVLHDGDLVEVDADNGVVRVFERAKGDNRNKYVD
jgi:phosphohistidine swiveling domain-containing protein